ncbi:hypothetical protein E2562_023839 [Oryza meyeriana var. granulata]|uniref:Disease resistance N-terminal domain-containing protein n=1 Tax=Oryza meyeriana var. granulata TaxID=110450 RepID=A0A6G1D7U7_9ORYZ|nr:hypothetical protein E2562_023839 [Oryza meyeriana var. granulata]
MAEAIVGLLVGRLQELALSEARALVGVNADIQKLRDKLMWLQAFLREADAKRRAVSDEVTKVWVLQTRDAVFDAEDALDHYYLQLDKSRNTPRREGVELGAQAFGDARTRVVLIGVGTNFLKTDHRTEPNRNIDFSVFRLVAWFLF